MKPNRTNYLIHPRIQRARRMGRQIVALESTVITHGLPHPENLALARDMEATISESGCEPATIAIVHGQIKIGLEPGDLEILAQDAGARKISVRDFATAVLRKENGGTTVAGTMFAAQAADIRVFATGGIGGVHREPHLDVSADLAELARSPMIVVCAGAKAILDLPATLEVLETSGVPVIGYGTDEFPAFYSEGSGLPVSARLDTPSDVAEYARLHWDLGFRTAVLVAQPPPAGTALPHADVEAAIEQALTEARVGGVRGPAVTPFLLGRISELTHSASLEANLALLKNNARLAAEIALELGKKEIRTIGYV